MHLPSCLWGFSLLLSHYSIWQGQYGRYIISVFTNSDPVLSKLSHPVSSQPFGSDSSALLLSSTVTTLARPAVTWCSSTRAHAWWHSFFFFFFRKRTLLNEAWPTFNSLHAVGYGSCSTPARLRSGLFSCSPRTYPYCNDIYILKYTSLFWARFHQLE